MKRIPHAVWPNGDACRLGNVEHYSREMGLSDDFAVSVGMGVSRHGEPLAWVPASRQDLWASPPAIRDLPIELDFRDEDVPMADPCPGCGAFRLTAGYAHYCGACDVCTAGTEQEGNHAARQGL